MSVAALVLGAALPLRGARLAGAGRATLGHSALQAGFSSAEACPLCCSAHCDPSDSVQLQWRLRSGDWQCFTPQGARVMHRDQGVPLLAALLGTGVF